MSQKKRLAKGGRINRGKAIKVMFDGRSYQGFEGDTLASILLANDVSLVGRSFKYHRPRGVFSAGVEEPNAMVHLREAGRHEPNVRATLAEAYDGLISSPQNAWPSLKADIGALNQVLAPFFSAGFYYKTFMGPGSGTRFWMMCEHFIRKAAGMGRAGDQEDPDHYEKINVHCDILIIGAGAAGLAAALAAGRSGLSVLLVEQDRELGGGLLDRPAGEDSDSWLQETVDQVRAMETVKILTRTTAFGAYDGDVYGLVERVWDHAAEAPEYQVRQRYWQVRTKQAILATGLIERPLVFGGNDKPGVMLSGAVRSYLNRYGVLPGQHVIVSTTNNSAYDTASELAAAGARVILCDVRKAVPVKLSERVAASGVQLMTGHAVLEAKGFGKVTSALITPVDETGRATGLAEQIPCDLIAVSAGFAPVLHLWSQRAGKPDYDSEKGCFVPKADSIPSMTCVGGMIGNGSIKTSVTDGFKAGLAAAEACGAGIEGEAPDISFAGTDWTEMSSQIWSITKENGKASGKAFIDLQHDVTRSDIDLAHREGFVSVEHLKRYTTTGMATDQGKLSNLSALARMAELRSLAIPEVGTTTFRPPYTPISIGSVVGHDYGSHFRATRYSPIHDWHPENGAEMIEAGAWMRPWYYGASGKNLRDAYISEADHVRHHVGMVDVSTLGKIAVQGPDAAEFLNRVYVNGWKTLQPGRIRYGVMLREDGFVLDDGTTARLGEHDYFMTTTTSNAAKVLAFMEHLLQTAWQDLKVHVTSVTDQWAAIAVAGPQSRTLLQAAVTGADLSADSLPNNHLVSAEIDGIPVRIHRMSYSGELAYEVYTPSGYGYALWSQLTDVGKAYNLRPYGTEAMGALRIEKGHVAGPELDGRTTLKDLALGGFASSKKPFVGSVLKNREKLEDPARPSLVGLEFSGENRALSGALLYSQGAQTEGHGEGHVTSTTYSPALGKNIALALLAGGADRLGDTVQVVDFVGDTRCTATVVSTHFFDPEGDRQNA